MEQEMMAVRRAVVVEDDDALASALGAFALGCAARVDRAATKAEALKLLAADDVDALLLDVALPDGSGVDLLPSLACRPIFPAVIAISGSADAVTAFALAQAGVRRFLTKPLDLRALEHAWDQALAEAPDLRPFIRACVGRRKLHDVESLVRREMTDEALAEGQGSRRKASALLGVSRQLLQGILRSRA